MKKNIFISVALIVVAILAGCSNQSMYPKFPVSALIRQTGDVVEGQVFDASKFEVVVNYLDNTTQTISGAGIQWTDGADKVAGMSADDTLTVNVGNDYYGKPVTNTISPSVYAVDHITAEAKSGVEFTVGTEAKSTDFVVSAYYTADKFIVLNAADYEVGPTTADTKAEGYDAEAEEVPATVKITFGTYEYTLNVTAANPQTPAPVMIGIYSVELAEDAIVLGYDYETLPEITAADVTVKALTETKNTFDLTAAQLADAEFSFVNATTQLPLRADEYDFTQYTTTSNVAIKVVLGDYEKVSNAITVTAPVVSVKYTGKALEQGADLAAVPADYYVTVKEGSNYRQLTDLTAEDFIFSSKDTLGAFTEGTGYENEVKDGKVPATLYVFVDYQGVQNKAGASVTTYAKGEAKVQSITATTAEGLVGPAKQYYTAIADVKPVTDKNAVLSSVTITTDQGSKTITSADTTEWAKVTIATAYSLSNTEDEVLAKGDDIMNASAIYLKVTYAATSCYVEIPFSTAVATGVTLSADYGKVAYYDAPVDWTIQLTNDWGVVDNDYTGAYTAYAVEDSSSKKAELPAKLGEAGSYKVAVVLEDGTLVESTAVSLKAGTEWYELGNDFKVSYTGEKIYIDDKLSGVTKDKFKASGATYHGGADEATQPEVTAVTVVNGEPVEASNTVYATVTYKGQDLQDHTKTVPVTIEGTPYGEASTATLAWAKDNTDVTTLPEGTYNVSDFVVKGYKAHGDAPIVITVKPQNGSAITSGTFQAKNYESVTFSYSYLDKSGEMTEVKELKTITVTAAVEEA